MSVVAMLIPYNNLYSQMGVPILLTQIVVFFGIYIELLTYIYSEGVSYLTPQACMWCEVV